MRALADYAMRGERHAFLAVLSGMMIPMLFWLGSAFVALVILRRGLRQSRSAIFAGAIAAIFWLSQGSPMTISCLASAIVMACFLRHTASWAAVLSLIIPLAIVATWVIKAFYMPLFDQTVLMTRKLHPEVLTYVMEGNKTMTESRVNEMLSLFLLKCYVFCTMAAALISLVIARYWQARLYNPEGFRNEINTLRLSFPVAFLLICLWIGSAYIPGYVLQAASACFVLPLLFAGIALVHGLIFISKIRQGNALLIITYLLLLIFYPLIVVSAFFDSFADFRGRLAARKKMGGQ